MPPTLLSDHISKILQQFHYSFNLYVKSHSLKIWLSFVLIRNCGALSFSASYPLETVLIPGRNDANYLKNLTPTQQLQKEWILTLREVLQDYDQI